MRSLIYPFTFTSDDKGSTKNKFELDRSDHDSHANRAEGYLV